MLLGGHHKKAPALLGFPLPRQMIWRVRTRISLVGAVEASSYAEAGCGYGLAAGPGLACAAAMVTGRAAPPGLLPPGWAGTRSAG